MALKLLDAGDGALTIEFGDAIEPRHSAAVQGLDRAIARLQAAGGLVGLIEAVPTFRSLTLLYDPLLTDRASLLADLQPIIATPQTEEPAGGRRWHLPVCYEGEAGPDLEATARALSLPVADVVALHGEAEYRVLMLGFLPGFPFLGELPESLRLPRRAEPRLRVPAGSVAIATSLTAIYPWESPGGWHLLGRCPVPLFDAGWPAPTLLAAGDRVRFMPVASAEFARLAAAAREIDPQSWQVAEDTP
jgi:KipI family sensor histidine kinase inhibitor